MRYQFGDTIRHGLDSVSPLFVRLEYFQTFERPRMDHEKSTNGAQLALSRWSQKSVSTQLVAEQDSVVCPFSGVARALRCASCVPWAFFLFGGP